MAYTEFDRTKPDESEGIVAYSSDIRTNDEALLDLLVMYGMMPGWDFDVTGGTNDLPTEITFTYSANIKIKQIITYDGSNRVSTFKAQKTTDAGSNWYDISYNGKETATYTYDGSGYVDSISWS